jgi:hypothetical protein
VTVDYPKTIAIVIADEEEANAVIGLMKPHPRIDKKDELKPVERVAVRIVASLVCQPGECMVCGCTEEEPCVIRRGEEEFACSWINAECTLCSTCLGIIEIAL